MVASEDPSSLPADPPVPPIRTRLAALLLGIAIAAALGWFVLSRMGGPSAVELVLSGQQGTRLYRERSRFAGAWNPEQAPPGRRHLPRFPVPEWVARELFPVDDTVQPFDELTYIHHPSHLDLWNSYPEHPGGGWRLRTNSLGLREDAEPMEGRPDLRILVTGDSHTDGVCDNAESFPHILQAELAGRHPSRTIEVLNAGKGAFGLYNYLGTLEKFLGLEPDVFVVAVYGPNDFAEVLPVYHYFQGTPRKPGASPYLGLVQKAVEIEPDWLAQDGLSLKFFQQYPDEIPVAVEAAREMVLDVQDLCRDRGILPVFVYLPGMFDTERRRAKPDLEVLELAQRLYEALELAPEDLDVHDRMADQLMRFLQERGIPALDARVVFAEREERFFWRQDHHIDVAAHRAIGEALLPVIESLPLEGLR